MRCFFYVAREQSGGGCQQIFARRNGLFKCLHRKQAFYIGGNGSNGLCVQCVLHGYCHVVGHNGRNQRHNNNGVVFERFNQRGNNLQCARCAVHKGVNGGLQGLQNLLPQFGQFVFELRRFGGEGVAHYCGLLDSRLRARYAVGVFRESVGTINQYRRHVVGVFAKHLHHFGGA